MVTKCTACGSRTSASAGYCQTCKSLRHHGLKRVKAENLLVDEAGGAWWIWDRRGDVLVSGKPTRAEAIIALARGEGDVEDDVPASNARHATKKKTPARLDAEIAEALISRAAPSKAKKSVPAATFSVMVQLPDDPRFKIPGMTLPPMYESVAISLADREEALALARKTQRETGRHARVYVDGRNYDTVDFGKRPTGYQPRSMTAKLVPGIPIAR